MNSVNLVGRLTRDPEARTFDSGTMKVSFGLAVNHTPYKKDGELVEEVSYFECEAWGQTAKVIEQYCKKGHKVGIENSELRQDRWADEATGTNRSRIFVRVNRMEFLEKANGSGTTDETEETSETPKTSGKTSRKRGPKAENISTDDIPF